LYSYAALTAKLTRALLGLFGEATIKMGHLVVFKGFTLNLGPECTEASCLVMYLSSTLAYPTSFKKKGIGIAIGLPVFYIINILRIALLAGVGVLYQPAFDFVHLFLFRATFIVFIIIVWVLWIDKVVKR
jgi:archaeosortase B (VPXXXP-CTERM-specific)